MLFAEKKVYCEYGKTGRKTVKNPGIPPGMISAINPLETHFSEEKIMKKILLVLIPVVLASSLAAQSTVFGLKGGVSLGWFSGSNWDAYISAVEASYGISIQEKAHTALHAGLFLDSMLTQHLGLVAELNYTQFGQDYEYSYAGTTFDGSYSMSAIDVPLLMKIVVLPTGGFYVLAGPSVNFLLGDLEFEESGGGASVSGSQTPDNQIVWGAVGGIGYGFEMTHGVMNLEVRYGFNLTDAFDADKNPFDVNGLQLLVGYGVDI